MKKPIMKMLEKSNPRIRTPRIIILAILLVLLTGGLKTMAQDTIITTRFANGYYDSINFRYYIDVELQSNLADIRVYGFNVRFFYEDSQLVYDSVGSIANFYQEIGSASQLSGNGAPWGVSGPLIWTNVLVQANLEGLPDVISTTGWTRVFKIYFKVKVNVEPCNPFCPILIWDLEENAGPVEGGYLPGDDGVVITVINQNDIDRSLPSNEIAVHYNWEYWANNGNYGRPVEQYCIGQHCTPVKDWPIYMAIGLMLLASVLIYRRRIS